MNTNKNIYLILGQREVNYVVRKLRKAFPYRKKKGINPKEIKKNIENEEGESDQNSDNEFFALKSPKKLKGKLKSVELPRVNLNA